MEKSGGPSLNVDDDEAWIAKKRVRTSLRESGLATSVAAGYRVGMVNWIVRISKDKYLQESRLAGLQDDGVDNACRFALAWCRTVPRTRARPPSA